MTAAISVAKAEGAEAVVCASTGNTSASMAAYAAKAGLKPLVLVPEGKIAAGKMAQAIVHGAQVIMVRGNFDDCLAMARGLAADYPVALVNCVNPVRLEGQKTAAFEIVDYLGDAPDYHLLPVGNAGNISAYWLGYTQYADLGLATRRPVMRGFQAAGAAPLVTGEPFPDPETKATAIRIGNPASWHLAEQAAKESEGRFAAVTDEQILAAQRELASRDGVFVEPASAAGIAGLLQELAAGRVLRRQHRRDHRHRPRPQGHRHRARGRRAAGRHRGRRRRRRGRRGGRPGLTAVAWRSSTDPVRVTRAGDLGQPRPGLRRARARPRPARPARGRGAARRPGGRGRGRRQRRACRVDERPPGRPRDARRLRRPWASSRRRPAPALPQRHPARPRAGLVVGRDRRRPRAGPRAGRRRVATARRRPRSSASPPDRGPPRQRRARLLRRLHDLRSRRRAATTPSDELLRRPAPVEPASPPVVARAARTVSRPRWPAGCCRPTVPHADAAANAGRAALLVAALAGDPTSSCGRPTTCCTRTTARPAMPDSLDLVDALRASGRCPRSSRAPGRRCWSSRRPPTRRGRRAAGAVPAGLDGASSCPSTPWRRDQRRGRPRGDRAASGGSSGGRLAPRPDSWRCAGALTAARALLVRAGSPGRPAPSSTACDRQHVAPDPACRHATDVGRTCT